VVKDASILESTLMRKHSAMWRSIIKKYEKQRQFGLNVFGKDKTTIFEKFSAAR
jgi:hypothetical protein